MTIRMQRFILAVFVAALLAGAVVVHHNVLTAPYPGHNDFLTVWEGARSFWVDGLTLFSEETHANIQIRIYGHLAQGDEIPNRYAYPFHAIFVMLPLVNLPYVWASAIWMVLLEAMLVLALFLLLDIYRWKPRPLMLALLLVWILFFYPSARGLILGQVGHFVFLIQVLALWGILRGHDTLAGAALMLSTVKPQMSYLFVPLLLLWALSRRRWRVVGTFSVLFGAVMLLSFVLEPGWLGVWLRELGDYPAYTAVGSPVWVIMDYYLGLGSAGEWVADIALYVLLLWTWYQLIGRRREERFLWTAMLTLTITHLAAPRTATTHFVVLAAPILFYIARLNTRGKSLWTVLILVALFVLPWWAFVATVSGELEHPITYVPLPFGVLAVLWLTRRTWWRTESAKY